MPNPPPKAQKPAAILTLRIALKNMKPPVWRRIEIPASSTFHDLHHYIQACMPWGDGHLHAFRKRDSRSGMRNVWTVEDRNFAQKDGIEFLDDDSVDERKALIVEYLREAGDTCVYEYDFGDGWEHEVKLEHIDDPDLDAEYPQCTKVKGVCPLEDSGGPWGWEDKIRVANDPKDPEYEDIREWLGLDPGDDFIVSEYELSPEEVTEALRDAAPRRKNTRSR